MTPRVSPLLASVRAVRGVNLARLSLVDGEMTLRLECRGAWRYSGAAQALELARAAALPVEVRLRVWALPPQLRRPVDARGVEGVRLVTIRGRRPLLAVAGRLHAAARTMAELGRIGWADGADYRTRGNG